MKNEDKIKISISVLSVLVLLLTFYYFSKNNLEYVYYGFLTIFLSIPFTIYISKKINAPPALVYGLCLLILINLCAGGVVYINGKILYEWIPLNIYVLDSEFAILKFDQIVHAFGAFMCTMVAYYLIKSKSKTNKYDHPIFALVLLLVGFGAASFYEIVEFLSKIFEYNAVGEYYNTVLDLCFNFIGASVGVLIAIKNYKRDR